MTALFKRPRQMPLSGYKERGFSLLEILVAFTILALALGILLQIFANGARQVHFGTAYSQATDLAESVLASAGTEIPLEPGMRSGQMQGLQWDLEIVPYAFNELLAPPQDVLLFLVTARVSWRDLGRQRALALQTLRVGTPKGMAQ